MKRKFNQCIVKWCEETDTYHTSIGQVCYLHLHGKKEEVEPPIKNDNPNTLGISVTEKISAGDKIG